MLCPQCGATLPGGALAGFCPACLLKQGTGGDSGTQPEGHHFEPPPLAELQRLFPQLEILTLLGKGGMGAVYKARQPALDRVVALKILPAGNGPDKSFSDRFTREAQALARLTHPNIVALHEFGQVEGWHYFIMEFVDGVNLRQLQKARRLSPREGLQIIPQMCDALQYAHDEGVVHRDIKPENVLLDRKGRVKIADFGLAKILGGDANDLRLTREGQVMGTPHYMAPEQVEHPLEVDHRADIYSLGVVFYEILTGELPLGKFAPPSSRVQVDIRLDDVVLHALEKDPERRYQQASQVKTEMQTIAAAPGPASPARTSRARSAAGVEYKSKARLLGLPFLHVATGMDPATGKRRVATGVIAIGDIARGGIAIGGVAFGGIALGGLAIGFAGFGGLGLGLLAVGGMAIGLLAGFGGGAIAPVAMGGGSLGYYAAGGAAFGVHSISKLGVDQAGWDFFQPWLMPLVQNGSSVVLWIGAAVVLVSGLFPLALQRHDGAARRSPSYWAAGLVTLLCAGICVAMGVANRVLVRIPDLYLVSGAVSDGRTGAPVPGTQLWASGGDSRRRSGAGGRTANNGGYSVVVLTKAQTVQAVANGYETNRVSIDPGAFGTKRHARVDIKLQPFRAASVETWSPTLSEGETPDLQKVLEEGRDLMKRGQHEEALQRFIWYYNHLQELGTAFSGVVYLLSDWVELGRRYPKAKKALLEIRDNTVNEFLEGRGYFEKFMELSTFNQYLQDEEASYQLFKKLEKQDQALAKQCFPMVQSLLVKHGEYRGLPAAPRRPAGRIRPDPAKLGDAQEFGGTHGTKLQADGGIHPHQCSDCEHPNLSPARACGDGG